MGKRKRMYAQSIEEKIMFRLKAEYKCSINEAWKLYKKFMFQKEMQKLNAQ